MTLKIVWFAAIGLLTFMGLIFKVMFVTVVMICQCCVNLSLSDIAIINVKVVDYCCIIHDISKSESVSLLENYVRWYI